MSSVNVQLQQPAPREQPCLRRQNNR